MTGSIFQQWIAIGMSHVLNVPSAKWTYSQNPAVSHVMDTFFAELITTGTYGIHYIDGGRIGFTGGGGLSVLTLVGVTPQQLDGFLYNQRQ